MHIMSRNHLAMAILLTSTGLASHMAAAQTGEAVVNFVGTIQEAGCQIDAETKDQAIDFGTISSYAFTTSTGYYISSQPVYIKLTNCPASISLAKILITGTSSVYNSHLLAIATGSGAATGLSIMFFDLNHHWVYVNGDNDFGQTISEGDNTLHYIATLTNYTSNAYNNVTPGTVSATATYSIEYQ